MKLQSACVSLQTYPPPARFSPPQLYSVTKHHGSHTGSTKQIHRFQIQYKSLLPSLRSGAATRADNVNSSRKLAFRVNAGFLSSTSNGSSMALAMIVLVYERVRKTYLQFTTMAKRWRPLRGKVGSVNFVGSGDQSVEESQLVSTPSKEDTDSLLWLFAPAALVSGLAIPQFYIVSVIEKLFKDAVQVELLSSISIDLGFYLGLAIFLLVTERVRQPYLQFSTKRWSLITGLKGYITSFKCTTVAITISPLLAVMATWDVLGISGLISVAPYIVGFTVQSVFEEHLDLDGSSCWPLLPIIFGVYRIYQLTRATAFMEKLLYEMRGVTMNPAALERVETIEAIITSFQLTGLLCLWSLVCYLPRFFPSRRVRNNY